MLYLCVSWNKLEQPIQEKKVYVVCWFAHFWERIYSLHLDSKFQYSYDDKNSWMAPLDEIWLCSILLSTSPTPFIVISSKILTFQSSKSNSIRTSTIYSLFLILTHTSHISKIYKQIPRDTKKKLKMSDKTFFL